MKRAELYAGAIDYLFREMKRGKVIFNGVRGNMHEKVTEINLDNKKYYVTETSPTKKLSTRNIGMVGTAKRGPDKPYRA
jgi:hypothetical protein